MKVYGRYDTATGWAWCETKCSVDTHEATIIDSSRKEIVKKTEADGLLKDLYDWVNHYRCGDNFEIIEEVKEYLEGK